MSTPVQILAKESDLISKQISQKLAELKDLRQKKREIEDGISMLGGDTPDIFRERKTTIRGGLSDTIVDCLPSVGQTGYTTSDIVEALKLVGFLTKKTTVSSTLTRLKDAKRVQNIDGKWFNTKNENPGLPGLSSKNSQDVTGVFE